MSALTAIRQLIRKMSKEEQRVTRSFLTAFSIRGSSAPNQALKLFDLLVRENSSQQALDDRAIESLIYGRNAGAAFPRLILRLRDKVFESLLLSINLERDHVYSERGRTLHEIRKKLSQAQILQSKGAWDLALNLLDECISHATKYEHYEELAAAMRVRLDMRSIDRGKISLKAEAKRYNKVIRCIVASKKALEYYHELCSQIEFNAGQISLSDLQANIDELQLEYEATGSATVAYYLNYMEAHISQELGLFKSASTTLKRLADLIEYHPAVHNRSRLVGVYVNLAWNEIYTRKFAVALRHSAKAKSVTPSNEHFNLYRCYDTEFYCHFYQGKYEVALETINILLKLDKSAFAEYRSGKREYQKACVLFMLGKHEQAHRILTTLNPIEEDQEGWNLALRMLYIMNDLELEKTDNAFNRIENMRKHIDKLKKQNKKIQREVLKFEILRTLVNTKFDFAETRKKRLDELTKLKTIKGEERWKIMSPELVIFDQWFESKVFRQQLKLKIPPYGTTIVGADKLLAETKVKSNKESPRFNNLLRKASRIP